MRRSPLVLVLVLALAAPGCRESDLSMVETDPTRGGPGTTQGPVDAVVTDPDAVVTLALDDVEAFWAARLPEAYGLGLEPLRGGRVPYGPDSPLPDCGDGPIGYDDIADNALYCPVEDLIAWDRVALIPSLQDQFGSLTVGIVMAHEYGHAIQNRGDVRGRTVTLELQADCFAGAWVADASTRIATFAADDETLDAALAGLLELRDTVGVSPADPQAHGSGFDRISAFQDGFEDGVGVCVTYEEDPPSVVAIPFGSARDARTGGNLPLDQLVEPLVADLESFFTALFDEVGETWDPVDGGLVAFDPDVDEVVCGDEVIAGPDAELASFYCVPEDAFFLDAVNLIPALDEIGDFAFGGELARLYAFAAQSQLGIASDVTGLGLHADCLTGVYSAAEFFQEIPDQQLSLSPGDLDEIIVAFLAFGDLDEAGAFERTAAFRAGFESGSSVCASFLG